MSKINLLYILIFSGILVATAQSKNAIQKIYNQYENEENVLSFSFSKNLKDAINSDFEWGEELKNIEGDITKMSTLIISESDESTKIIKEIKRQIPKLGYKELKVDENKADSEEIHLFTSGKKGNYSEVHLLVISDDGGAVLASFYGNFRVRNAS